MSRPRIFEKLGFRAFLETPDAARMLWVQSLRGGSSRQARTFLLIRDAEGIERRCCLGVAVALFAERYPDILKIERRELIAAGYTAYRFLDPSGRFVEHELPDVVRRWLGLADPRGRLRSDYASRARRTIADINDEGTSFAAIAEIIERGELELEHGPFIGAGQG